MRISIVIFWLVSSSLSLLAQTDSGSVAKKKVVYFNNFSAGGLLGESGYGTGVTLSTTHGIRLNRLAVGAGVGFDSYMDWKTIPVFGSVSFDFGKIRRNAFFVQFNAGYSDASRVKPEEWLTDYREYGGEMICSMLGYRISTEKFSIYMSAGHKFQKAHFSYNVEPWSSFAPSPSQRVEENMNRLVVQIGFGLH